MNEKTPPPVVTLRDANKAAVRWAAAGRPRHVFEGVPDGYCAECGGSQRGIQHAGQADPLTIPIAEMHVQCSFPMREVAVAASDTCRRFASSGVISGMTSDGTPLIWWRCAGHEGLVRDGVAGYVVTRIPKGA